MEVVVAGVVVLAETLVEAYLEHQTDAAEQGMDTIAEEAGVAQDLHMIEDGEVAREGDLNLVKVVVGSM